MVYRAILFDIDGTLIRAGGAGKVALAKALEQLHAIEQPLVDINYGGRTDMSITRELFQLHKIPWSVEAGLEFLRNYAGHFYDSLKTKSPILLPGVKELLNHLREQKQHHMGLLTGNIQECAKIKLNAFDLWQYFDFGGFGDHHEDRSEIAAEAYRQAARRHHQDLKPHEVLIIGDTPADVRCARSIGADVLIVGTGPVTPESIHEVGPDYFHEDLSKLDQILALLNRKN